MQKIFVFDYESNIGTITLASSEIGLVKVNLPINDRDLFIKSLKKDYSIMFEQNDIIIESINQLKEYFLGKRKKFDLPLDINGTDFQKSIWSLLQKIPYAKLYSYMDLAIKIKNVGAVRAVGQANKANPIPIIIPCHRVIGSNGGLTGFAGSDPKNIEFKKLLLDIEKQNTSSLVKFITV